MEIRVIIWDWNVETEVGQIVQMISGQPLGKVLSSPL